MKKEYKMPEDILNYNDNWNTVSGLMEVFHAYNQQQQDEGKPWSVEMARLGVVPDRHETRTAFR